jgi:hypothetical protein
MVKHRKQHTVSSCYLKAWVDPQTPPGQTPYVHLFDIHGGDARHKSPAKILRMPDLYTIFRDGVRDLRIEHTFGEWETNFVRVRNILESTQFGTDDDVANLYAFVGAMLARAPHRIGFMKNQWASVAERMLDVKTSFDPAIAPIHSLSSDGPSMNLAQVQELANNPMGTWFPHSVASYVETLSSLFGYDVLVNQTVDHSFLTSDAPAIIHHRSSRNAEPRGLASLGCEITLPLSPRLALLFRHKLYGGHAFLSADWETVFEVNRRTIAGARKTIVSDKPDIFFVRAITEHIAKYDAEHPS